MARNSKTFRSMTGQQSFDAMKEREARRAREAMSDEERAVANRAEEKRGRVASDNGPASSPGRSKYSSAHIPMVPVGWR